MASWHRLTRVEEAAIRENVALGFAFTNDDGVPDPLWFPVARWETCVAYVAIHSAWLEADAAAWTIDQLGVAEKLSGPATLAELVAAAVILEEDESFSRLDPSLLEQALSEYGWEENELHLWSKDYKEVAEEGVRSSNNVVSLFGD